MVCIGGEWKKEKRGKKKEKKGESMKKREIRNVCLIIVVSISWKGKLEMPVIIIVSVRFSVFVQIAILN